MTMRNVIWDMMMNGMMNGLIDLMMSEAYLRCLVDHRLHILVDGRHWPSVHDLIPPPSGLEYIMIGV